MDKKLINQLPEEISCKIYGYYLQNILNSQEFKKRYKRALLRSLARTKSQKQLRQLGLI